MSTNVVGGSSITAFQMKNFWRQVGDGSITRDTLQAFLEHRDPFAEEQSHPTALSVRTIQDQIAEWLSLYKKMGIELDLSTLKSPERKEGFDRLIVVAKGMTNNHVFEECKKRFPAWKYTYDLNEDIPTND